MENFSLVFHIEMLPRSQSQDVFEKNIVEKMILIIFFRPTDPNIFSFGPLSYTSTWCRLSVSLKVIEGILCMQPNETKKRQGSVSPF